MELFPSPSLKLQEVTNRYNNRTIDREQFWREMQQCYAPLFDCIDFLNDTDVLNINLDMINREVLVSVKGLNNLPVTLNYHLNDISEPFVYLLIGENAEHDLLNMSKILLDKLQNAHCFLDVGANIGVYSLFLAKVFPTVKFHAFEPLPSVFDRLIRNVALNQLHNVKGYNIGLHYSKKELDMYYNPAYSGRASEADNHDMGQPTITIAATKIDDFIQHEKISQLDMIKCDTEGSELFVFQGGKTTIEKYKPIILSEMMRKWQRNHNYHPNDVIAFFEQLGYSTFVVFNIKKLKRIREITEETEERNCFFLHNQKHAHIIQELCDL